MVRSDNRPTKFVSPAFVANLIIEQGPAYNEGAARRRIEQAFNVSPNTARARLRAAKPAIDEGRRMLAGLAMLRPRHASSTE
jgi:predicted RecB family endonuclease